MTAPTGPDRTGVVARLDALEAAHKAATPGPWAPATAPSEDGAETHAEYLTNALRPEDGRPLWVAWAPADGELHPGCDYVVPVVTGDGPTSEANARFVAAAHDAVPDLLAVVRGVLALADEMERDSQDAMKRSDDARQRDDRVLYTTNVRHARIAQHAANDIRATVAAALGWIDEPVQDERWRPCPDCGCQTSALEWACWRCGAVQDDEEA